MHTKEKLSPESSLESKNKKKFITPPMKPFNKLKLGITSQSNSIENSKWGHFPNSSRSSSIYSKDGDLMNFNFWKDVRDETEKTTENNGLNDSFISCKPSRMRSSLSNHQTNFLPKINQRVSTVGILGKESLHKTKSTISLSLNDKGNLPPIIMQKTSKFKLEKVKK